MAPADVFRIIGNLERCSTARHHLTSYRSVAITAKYAIRTTHDAVPAVIEAAVAQVTLQHPHLCCGIIDEDKGTPTFVRIESVDLSRHIEYQSVKSGDEYDLSLAKVIEIEHQRLWPNLDRQPGWRVVVVHYPTAESSNDQILDVVFSYHHGPCDGTSGVVFHRSLHEALNHPEASPPLDGHVLEIPGTISLFPAVENIINFKVSWSYFAKVVWGALGPKWLVLNNNLPWTGEICSPKTIEKYQSRVKFFTLPADSVSIILLLCRKQETTLTGLLHGLVITSLAKRVPHANSFQSTTPYSLRHLSGRSPTTEMVNEVSAFDMLSSPAILATVRQAENDAQVNEQIWTIARDFRTQIVAELASLPNDTIVGMMPYMSSVQDFYQSKLGQPRACTYEISNVGCLKSEGTGNGSSRIQRVLFTQCGNVTGSAFDVNVASVEGGPMALSMTWADGNINGELVRRVVEDVKEGLVKLASSSKDS